MVTANMDKILQEVAEKNGVSIVDVRREIQSAIDVGMSSPDPKTRAYWGGMPCRGDKPTPEELLAYLFYGSLIA